MLPSSMQSVCGKVAVGENTKISIPRGLCLSLELIIKKMNTIKPRFTKILVSDWSQTSIDVNVKILAKVNV